VAIYGVDKINRTRWWIRPHMRRSKRLGGGGERNKFSYVKNNINGSWGRKETNFPI
jgi:hypothetical protein